MAKSSSSKIAVDPAQSGPGGADTPAGSVGNFNLGRLQPVSRGGRAARQAGGLPLRAKLDALYRDTIACSDAARRWFDGPGRPWRAGLPPQAAAAAALEGLAVTTRLLTVMNWLLDPAHDGPAPVLKPLAGPADAALPADHPLQATPGAAIAQAGRQIHARALALAGHQGDAA